MVVYELDLSGISEIEEALLTAEKSDKYVEVGLFDPEQAQKGFQNEYGTLIIPARPFVRASVELNEDKYIAIMRKQATRVISEGSELNLNALGQEAALDMAQYVNDLKEPKNAPSTIAMKGFDNPLVNTRAMEESITYKVGGDDTTI